MTRRRIWRFFFEVVFLGGAATVATVAELRPLGVIVLMALAWIVVALFEWTSWLGEPHFGRGLPPRFYVPQISLPPPRPVEQPRSSYPAAPARDDTPTWVVSADEWATALDSWPVLPASPAGEETQIAVVDDPLPEFPPEIKPLARTPLTLPPVDEDLVEDIEDADTGDVGPDLIESGFYEPEVFDPDEDDEYEEDTAEPAVAAARTDQPAAAPTSSPVAAAPAPAPPVERTAAPGSQLTSAPIPDVVSTHRPSRHQIDPIGVPQRRRLFARRPRTPIVIAELPGGPPPGRPLPSNVRGENSD